MQLFRGTCSEHTSLKALARWVFLYKWLKLDIFLNESKDFAWPVPLFTDPAFQNHKMFQ